MKKMLAICDKDEGYVYRLRELLARREAFPFEVSSYTDRDAFEEELFRNRFGLVLASGEFYRTACSIDEDKRPPLILLRGKNDDDNVEPSIWKYQSGEDIRKEIMEKCPAQQQSAIAGGGGKKTVMIGIFSPVCHSLQTTISLLAGQFLAKKGSVLYLNFEPFSGLHKLLGGTGDRDLTDLVYYMQGGKEKLVYKLESMVGNINGLDYISPAFSFVDLGQVKEESWLMLIETLREIGTYDYVILDLSEMVQGLLNVLRECDSIYTIADREGLALARMEQYEELLRSLDYDDVLKRSRRCELPRFKNIPSSIEELPYSDLAVYVRKVMEEDERRGREGS